MKSILIILAFLVFDTLAAPSTPDLMMTKEYCGQSETECPAGCCSHPGWYCCSDNQYCAATPNDCPNGPMIFHLHGKKVLKCKYLIQLQFPLLIICLLNQENCQSLIETGCQSGCCPYPGWYCCPDNQYCAATLNDCPNVPYQFRSLKESKIHLRIRMPL